MRAIRRIFIFFAVAAALFSVSCGDTLAHKHCEIVLNLPKEYESANPKEPFVIEDSRGIPTLLLMSSGASIDMALCDSQSVVALTRISNEAAYEEGISPVLTQLDFARFYMELSNIDSEVKLHSDIPYYTYTVTSNTGEEFKFLATFYRSPYAYFVVLYAAVADVFDGRLRSFLDYASDVGFE